MRSGKTVPAGGADTVYLAADGFQAELHAELVARGERVLGTRERLVFARGGSDTPAAWARNTWFEPREVAIESISQAARMLRGIQRNWKLHAVAWHRRAALIADQLPPIRFRALEFPCDPPGAPLGAWTLLERDRLLFSPRCSSGFPDGEAIFAEDRSGPPNRAYLKLWEALVLARARPGPGDRCLDLGAAPGGWSWVLAQLGARVISVDRAELTPALMRDPRVEHRRGDAFRLTCDEAGPLDWIFSDLIAYPERVLALVRYWAEACPGAGLVFSIKLQGEPAPSAYRRFLDIPGGRLMHLTHNKHELTFFRLPGGGPPEAAYS